MMKRLLYKLGKPSAVLLAILLCAGLLAACGQKGAVTTAEFKKACEDDGFTVTENADKSAHSDLDGLETYWTADHGSEDILMEFMDFSDADHAQAAYEKLKTSLDPGLEGSMQEVDNQTFKVLKVKRDSRCTKLVLANDQILSGGGSQMYESEISRIIQKFGYQ